MQQNQALESNLIDFDRLFSQGNSKLNKTIKLTAEDRRSGMRVFCTEPYAQAMYDALYSSTARPGKLMTKDFDIDHVCKVVAKKVDFENKVIETQDIASMSTIYVPFREFTEDPNLLLINEASHTFKVIIYKNDGGHYLGSEKRCAAITYREDLEDFLKENKWFYVKVISLVKGGYLALYKGTIKCFLPGSHAAANVIRDFNEYLNKEIPVMVENYDAANDLFIISYKKYIKHTLPQRVHELKFGEQYTGVLTNNPYDFGMFVEFHNYFTGLLHKSEFSNYESESKAYKSGDTVQFYIKDITVKKGEPRIVLTTSRDLILEENLAWQDLKAQIEGKTLNYELNRKDFNLEVELPDSDSVFRTDANHLKGRVKIEDSGQIRVHKVDVIRKQMRYDFF